MYASFHVLQHSPVSAFSFLPHRWPSVILLASFHSPEVIFEELSLIYSLPRYLVRSFRLILPYFPTATMERVDKEGQVVTAKVRLATVLCWFVAVESSMKDDLLGFK